MGCGGDCSGKILWLGQRLSILLYWDGVVTVRTWKIMWLGHRLSTLLWYIKTSVSYCRCVLCDMIHVADFFFCFVTMTWFMWLTMT